MRLNLKAWGSRERWLLVSGLTGAYALAFGFLYRQIGEGAAAVGILVPVLAGGLLGPLAGAGWGLAMIPLDLVLHRHLSPLMAEGIVTAGMVGAGIGLLVGRIQELGARSRTEREELQRVLAREQASAVVLKERKAQLVIAQELTRVGSWHLDIQTQKLSWSRGLFQMFGLTPELFEPDLASCLALVHADDRERVKRALLRATVASGTFDEEFRVVHSDGSIRHVQGRATRTLDDKGEPLKLVGAAQDVTEQRQLQERMASADRAASLGTLAAGMAHEVNNPLAYVVANLAFLSEELRPLRASNPAVDWAELDSALAEAREGADRVRQIVQDLKAFSRSDEASRGLVDLRGVLDFSLRMTRNQLSRHARMEERLEDVPLVDGNAARLGQVVVNLLMNAAQAIPPGHAEENEIRVSTRTASDGSAVSEVKDTGVGIPPELRKRIFEPFFTTKAVGVGRGLGLSICRGIVTGLGGAIEVESEPGQGSTFRVILPPFRG